MIKLIIFDCYGLILNKGYPNTSKALAKRFGGNWQDYQEVMYKKYFNMAATRQISQKQVFEKDLSRLSDTKQATAFRIKVIRDIQASIDNKDLENIEKDTKFEYEFTDPKRAELFAGKKVYLDWNKVRELAQAAETRFKQKS